MKSYHIASISWGKDSLAMLHMLIENGNPLDEVVFFDTGMEFEAIYNERDKMIPLLQNLGIKYTELHPKESFYFSMFVRPVRSRKTGLIHKYGYGWCGGPCRWGTTEKQRALDRYAEQRDAIVYIGIAVDEVERLAKQKKGYKRHPLADWDMTEYDCLKHCKEHGHTWMQDGISLYEVLDRVSCWCCRNKNLKELRGVYEHLPNTWERLKGVEQRIGEPMKRKTLTQLEKDWS